VTSGTDDDALSWDGDDDPTLDVGPSASRPAGADPAAVSLPDGFTAVGRGSDRLQPNSATLLPSDEEAPAGVEADVEAEAQQMAAPVPAPALGNAMLIAVGVFVGAYALYTIGWIIGGLRLQGYARFLVAPVGYQVSLWLAIAAPAIWFATVWLLTRASKVWIRIVWLVVGLALLIPWPFILVGAVGQ